MQRNLYATPSYRRWEKHALGKFQSIVYLAILLHDQRKAVLFLGPYKEKK